MKNFTTRWRALFIVVCLFFSSVTLFAQDQLVTVKLKNATLEELFSTIEKQTTYRFSYRNAVIDNTTKNVNLSKTDVPVQSVLKEVLSGTNLEFSVISQKSIVITDKLVDKSPSQGAKRRVSGVVTDTHKQPVVGATAIIKGSSTGDISGVDGTFSLDAPMGAIIEISMMGYKPFEVEVGSADRYNVVLEEQFLNLDEVVVVGYGTNKKVNLTGSVASVSSEDVKNRVQTNLLSSIQGTVPGVTVVSRPGGGSSINFRGRGNLGTSAPLYVIDGTIANSTFFNNLDPNSIESISFLKDASSSAIYGSRAAYGVVLVTTKQGQNEKMVVNYNGYFGVSTPTYVPEMFDAVDYAQQMNESIWNRDQSKGKYQAYTPDEIAMFKNGTNPDLYANTDWVDLVLTKSAPTTRHSIDFSGGSAKLRYFAGVGYLYNKNQNFMPGRKNDRYNMNLSLQSEIKKWLTVRAGAKYIKDNSNSNSAAPSLHRLVSAAPIMAAKQSNGEWGSMSGGVQAQQTFLQNNPLRVLDKKDWSKNFNENLMLDFGVDLKPIEGLVLKGTGAYTSTKARGKSYAALQDEVRNFPEREPITGTGTYINSMNMDWSSQTRMLYTATANYEWKNDKHSINILGGTSYEDTQYEAMTAMRRNFPIDGLGDLNAGSDAGTDISNSGSSYQTKMLSFFGRVNYSYDDRYLFEANIRSDASSVFHPSNRWGIFPSFSAGWRISQEKFMKDVSWLNNLKLRASWGQLGNINNVGYYDYFQSYSSGANYSFDDVPVKGISESRPANSTLSWETVTQTNIGLDMDVLGGKLSLTAEYYIKETSDILLGYSVPQETGISKVPSQNLGKVENRGVELAITHRNSYGDFSYMVSGNMSYNKNKITDLGESDNMIYKLGNMDAIHRVGEPIGSYYGYFSDKRLYSQQEIDKKEYYRFGRTPNAGDIRYLPMRENVQYGDGITGDDRVILGSNEPKFTYGINVNLNYKGIELSALGQGVCGTKLAVTNSPFQTGDNPRKAYLNSWSASNPDIYARFPRMYGGTSLDDYNNKGSDFSIIDVSYFRLKSVSLGYSIPPSLFKNSGISNLKIFLTGENIATASADKIMKDIDPEHTAGYYSALGSKTYAIGVNITF